MIRIVSVVFLFLVIHVLHAFEVSWFEGDLQRVAEGSLENNLDNIREDYRQNHLVPAEANFELGVEADLGWLLVSFAPVFVGIHADNVLVLRRVNLVAEGTSVFGDCGIEVFSLLAALEAGVHAPLFVREERREGVASVFLDQVFAEAIVLFF